MQRTLKRELKSTLIAGIVLMGESVGLSDL